MTIHKKKRLSIQIDNKNCLPISPNIQCSLKEDMTTIAWSKDVHMSATARFSMKELNGPLSRRNLQLKYIELIGLLLIHSLKVLERCEKQFWVSSSMEGKSQHFLARERECATSQMIDISRGSNESRNKNSSSINYERPSSRADEQVEIRKSLVLSMGNFP